MIVDGSSGSHSALREIEKFLELKDPKNIQYSCYGCWRSHDCKLTPCKDCCQKMLNTVKMVEECKGSYSKD